MTNKSMAADFAEAVKMLRAALMMAERDKSNLVSVPFSKGEIQALLATLEKRT
jgi:hypothetical protein